MSKNFYLIMSGVDYEETVGRTVQDAKRFGVDELLIYDDVWLSEQPFYQVNRWLWETPIKRGYGWHAFKPFLLLHAMQTRMADGDIALLCDADTYPLRDLRPLYDRARQEGAVLFDCSGRKQKEWCTRDCFVAMGLDEPRYHDSLAGCARFVLVKKGDWKAFQLVCEWLAYCTNPMTNTRGRPLVHPNLDGFIEHRTDQAILTLLAHKHGYPLYQEASQGSAHTPQYFEQVHCTTGENMAGRNPGTHSRHFNGGPR